MPSPTCDGEWDEELEGECEHAEDDPGWAGPHLAALLLPLLHPPLHHARCDHIQSGAIYIPIFCLIV